MRPLLALLALLMLLGLPSNAHADVGLSAELRYARRAVAPAAERPESSVREAPTGASRLAGRGGGATVAALPAVDGSSVSTVRSVAKERAPRQAVARIRGHSSYRAAERRHLRLGPVLALATLGVIGHHTSPAPPLG